MDEEGVYLVVADVSAQVVAVVLHVDLVAVVAEIMTYMRILIINIT